MNQILTVSRPAALKAYRNAPVETKFTLEELFGRETFTGSIMDRVKDFDDILAIAGKTLDQVALPGDTADEGGYKMAKLIAEVYNEGTEMDPNNLSQTKYFPWFEITPGSGFGLSYNDYADWNSLSSVGVRLAFKSKELAIDAGKKFPKVYAMFLIN